MPTFDFKKESLPFILGGNSAIAIKTANVTGDGKLDESGAPIFEAGFSTSDGAKKLAVGRDDSVKVELDTEASVKLTPVFAGSTGDVAKLPGKYGVGDYFKTAGRDGQVLLVFEAGASVDGGATGAFAFAALKAGVTLKGGIDGGFAYCKPMPKSAPLPKLLAGYFETMRLPAHAGARGLEPGEAISLRFGGYLKLGAEVAAGFRMTGSQSFTVRDLVMAEKYDLSISGAIGLNASVAGQYSILLRASDDPEWVRVQVRRHNAKQFSVAADVKVGFKNQLQLPDSADEFLGAALGVNAKSFLTVFQKAVQLSDFEKFKAATDKLAQRYISEFIGKGFDTLSAKTPFNAFLGTVNRVVTSYEEVGDRAVTLFDRYFDRLNVLTPFLERLASLEASALASLKKELTTDTWNILAQLTDGDPLGFLLDQVTIGGQKLSTITELKARATAALDLIKSEAHKDIRRVVELAKSSFGADRLFKLLATIDTKEELQALANEKAGEFVTRLVGRALDSSTNIRVAFDQVHAVLARLDGFKNKLFEAFKGATNSSYSFALHAQYSRASETDSLVDVLIHVTQPGGEALLREAAHGDFSNIIPSRDTDLVRLLEGVFTHRTQRESAFAVNIVGWHLNYKYSGFDRVITETEQRLVPSEHGITVFTTMDLTVARMRQRQDETRTVNFLLRALGESGGVVADGPPGNSQFLVDTLTSLTSKYKLDFVDADTSPGELADNLAFARDTGLDTQGARLDVLEPMLPKTPVGDFGTVEAHYEVRFNEQSLQTLVKAKVLNDKGKLKPDVEDAIRATMRRMLLANYLRGNRSHEIAFAYATPAMFKVVTDAGATFTNGEDSRRFSVSIEPGIQAPQEVSLDRFERIQLDTLYRIENKMVDAIRNLYRLIEGGKKLKPSDFEDKLADFAGALKDFDDFDQTSDKDGVGVNSIFAVFDALVRLASKDTANVAVLRLKNTVGTQSLEKLFMTDAAIERPAAERAPSAASRGRVSRRTA
jgi:hypothetical protein